MRHAACFSLKFLWAGSSISELNKQNTAVSPTKKPEPCPRPESRPGGLLLSLHFWWREQQQNFLSIFSHTPLLTS